MEATKQILDALLEQRIITGYNIFDRPINRGKYNFVLSNLHETEAYLEDVKRDFDSLNLSADFQVRDRQTSFCWKPNYRFRNDNNNVYPEIILRKNKEIIDLEKITAQTFIEAGYSSEFCKGIFCENKALEINIACNLEEEIKKLAYLFNEHSFVKNKNAWRDAYKTPAIIIEGQNLEIKEFGEIFLFRKITSNYEASFLMHEERLLILPSFQKKRVYVNKELIDYISKELDT